MRHAFFILAATAVMAAISGCACNNCCNTCNNSSGMHRAAAGREPAQAQAQQGGGPGGVVSYPYYTTRGPRDFLETHPQSIGP